MCKTTLKAAELRTSLEELARFGSPVDLSVATRLAESENVEIAQVGGIYDSSIFELPDGRIACVAGIAVTNQTSRTMYVEDVELRTSWGDSQWDWLQPQRYDSEGRAKGDYSYVEYRFPGKCGLHLEYKQVINHVFLERRSLPSRRPLEGFLLGIGGLMPAELRHGQWLKLTLAIIGSDHTEYASAIHLRTERLEVQPKIVKPRTSIFAKEEIPSPQDVERAMQWAPRPAGPLSGRQGLASQD